MRINTKDLTELIGLCFDLATDDRVPAVNQRDLLALGKRMRGSLLNLLTAEFADGTQAVIDANSKISDLNQRLTATTQSLSNAAQLVTQVGQLVSILDGLLNIARSFV